MYNDQPTIARAGALETNKVLRQTYMLLSATLIFSGLMAMVSMAINPGHMVSLLCSIGAIALIWFVLPRTANSAAGLVTTFALTGLLGFGLGPVLNYYLALSNGGQLIATALGGTGVIFLGLSGYALTTRKDFSFLGGFLVVGFLVAIGALLLNLFLQIPALDLTISAAIIFLMSGFILYDTSRIIHGGETNYIMATVGIYLSIYNIFVSLLHILGALSGDD
jgi:modulator of FtsH protease